MGDAGGAGKRVELDAEHRPEMPTAPPAEALRYADGRPVGRWVWDRHAGVAGEWAWSHQKQGRPFGTTVAEMRERRRWVDERERKARGGIPGIASPMRMWTDADFERWEDDLLRRLAEDDRGTGRLTALERLAERRRQRMSRRGEGELMEEIKRLAGMIERTREIVSSGPTEGGGGGGEAGMLSVGTMTASQGGHSE